MVPSCSAPSAGWKQSLHVMVQIKCIVSRVVTPNTSASSKGGTSHAGVNPTSDGLTGNSPTSGHHMWPRETVVKHTLGFKPASTGNQTCKLRACWIRIQDTIGLLMREHITLLHYDDVTSNIIYPKPQCRSGFTLM